jgi:hypothetical protein
MVDAWKIRLKRNADIHTLSIIEAIEESCRTSMIEGAANYTYNPNLVARLYGLIDKQEHTITVSQNLSELPTSELNKRVQDIKILMKHRMKDTAEDANEVI